MLRNYKSAVEIKFPKKTEFKFEFDFLERNFEKTNEIMSFDFDTF